MEKNAEMFFDICYLLVLLIEYENEMKKRSITNLNTVFVNLVMWWWWWKLNLPYVLQTNILSLSLSIYMYNMRNSNLLFGNLSGFFQNCHSIRWFLMFFLKLFGKIHIIIEFNCSDFSFFFFCNFKIQISNFRIQNSIHALMDNHCHL